MDSQPPLAARCAVASRAAGESGTGTAPPVRSWLLVERPGAWSRSAVAEMLAEALPAEGRRRIGRLGRDAGLRTLLVRRPGRDAPHGTTTVFLGSASPTGSWLERRHLGDLRELADLDLDRLAAGLTGQGTPVDGPLLLVCTHGSKDMCCAVEGRPVARELAAVHGERVWEASHVGGDRFAGNLVVAPHGEYYGHLDPAGALVAASAALQDEVAPAGFRGRSTYDPWQQAAEAAVRDAYSLRGRAQVECGPGAERDGGVEVVVATSVGPLAVRLERRVAPVVAASRCRGAVEPAAYAVVSMTRTRATLAPASAP